MTQATSDSGVEAPVTPRHGHDRVPSPTPDGYQLAGGHMWSVLGR